MAKGIYINPTTFVPLNQLSEGLTSEIATRKFAAGSYTGFFNYLPDPDPVLRKLGMDQSVYEDLLSDDQCGPLVNRRKYLTKSLNWDIQQNEASDQSFELCKLAFRILEKNGCAIKDIISQTLNPVFYGYSVFEIKWGIVNGYWLPIEIWEKPREWFVFDSENRLRFRTNYNYEGIIIRGEGADPKIAVKFILLRNDPTYKNPYGDKALSRCFWPVSFKRGGMKFLTNFLEKYGMPYLFGKLPRGAKEEDHLDLLAKLNNMVQDACGTGPDDSSLQLLEPKGTAGSIHEDYLKRCDNAIAKAILLNALSTDIQKSGARASADTGAVIIEGDIKGTDQDFPTTFFDILFQRICDLNIGNNGEEYPTFEVKELENINKDLSDRDVNLKELNVNFTPDYFKRRYNLEDDEFTLTTPTPSFSLPIIPSANNNDIPNPDLQFSGINFLNTIKKLLGGRIELSDKVKKNKGAVSNGPNNNIADLVSSSLPDKFLQFGIEQTLKPVIELAKKSSSRKEFESGLAALYPKMDTSQLETIMTKLLFIANTQGRLDVQETK